MINTQYLKKDTLNYASCSFDKQALILTIFGLDALAKALSAIATATWLGGWLAGCHTPVLY